MKANSRTQAVIEASVDRRRDNSADFGVLISNLSQEPIFVDSIELDGLDGVYVHEIEVRPRIPRPIKAKDSYSWSYHFAGDRINTASKYRLKVQLHGSDIPYASGLAQVNIVARMD